MRSSLAVALTEIEPASRRAGGAQQAVQGERHRRVARHQIMHDRQHPVLLVRRGLREQIVRRDLGKEPAKIAGRELRFRKLVIEPGGIVPWHSHDDRPALIYVAEGEIQEYASNCAATIVHKAGDIRAETQGTSHWWKNLGDKTVVLFVGDVRRDPTDHNM